MRWRPKKLYIYIVRRFVPLLLAGFSVSLFIVVIQFLWQSIGSLVGKGVDGLILLRLLFFASMTMVPLALVLGVLLASLMTYGYLGERMELLAMKAAGIPLSKILKPVFIFVVALAVGLFIFQNDWMIQSQVKFWQYYFSITNKAPELAIPEGSFYKGVDNYSMYVQRKDADRKMLYGVMVYDYTNGFDQSMVVVADSGRLYSTTAGKELILELYGGESFQNLGSESGYSQSSAERPFIRERFGYKELRIPFNTDLSMVDESILSSQFVGKNMWELKQYTDSLRLEIDSLSQIGIDNGARLSGYQRLVQQMDDAQSYADQSHRQELSRAYDETTSSWEDSTTWRGEEAEAQHTDAYGEASDSIAKVEEEVVSSGVQSTHEMRDATKVNREPLNISQEMIPMGASRRSTVYDTAISLVDGVQNETFFLVEEQRENVDLLRKNESEYWRKVTYPVACIAFFLIGAPLGALIRKGGMGVPFLVAVSLFIVFYILETFGMKMAREGTLMTWVGMWLPNMVLVPVGVMLCLVAARDTNRLSLDFLAPVARLFKRNKSRGIEYKEVTMESVDYDLATRKVESLDRLADAQLKLRGVRYVAFFSDKAYFGSRKQLSSQLESVVGDLQHSRDYALVDHLNGYPLLGDMCWRSRRMGVNKLLMWLLPVGIICYLCFRVQNKRYIRKVKAIKENNQVILKDIDRVMRGVEQV